MTGGKEFGCFMPRAQCFVPLAAGVLAGLFYVTG